MLTSRHDSAESLGRTGPKKRQDNSSAIVKSLRWLSPPDTHEVLQMLLEICENYSEILPSLL